MVRRRDVETQKTLTSEAEVEAKKVNQARSGHKPRAYVQSQTAIEKQAQMEHALRAFYRSPEVRAGKLEALRVQIEAGTYQINRTALAMKLLGIPEQDAD